MTTNAQVVQLFTDVLTRWNEREAEFRDWQAGTAEGGPNADGRYPLTNGSNETFLVACPAKLASTVSGPAVLSQAAQVAAEAAQSASETASTQSNSSRILAENHKNAALAARDLALLYRDQCAAAQTAVLSAQVSIDAALVVIEDNVEITEALANETLEARDDTLVARAEAVVARDQAEDFAASINPATLATKAELQSELSALIDAAPGTLNTLNEIAAALGDDPNFATTITSSVAGKAPLVHSHVISDVTGLNTALAGKQPVGSYAGSVHGHVVSDVTGLQTALDGKQVAGSYAASVHGHVISDVTGLQTALDGKQASGSYAAASHVHTIANVTGLQTALDGKQASGSYSLTGHSHVIADVTGLQTALDGKQASGSYVTTSNFTWTNLSGKPTTFAPSAHAHVISDVTGLQTALDGKQASLGFTPYNSTNPAGYITAAALSPYAPLNGPAFTGSVSIGGGAVFRSDWTTRYQSGSDFVDGTLVTTDIPAAAWAGESFVIEITGKTYDQNNPPVKVVAQGYLYNDTIINYSGVSYAGNFASYIKVFEEGGVLKFWWPRISYWNSFNVNVMAMDGQTNGTITRNRVTAIANSGEPTGTKKQQINLTKTLKTGDAAGSISGFNNPVTAPTANTIVYRDGAGDISAREIVLSSGLSAQTPSVLVSMYPNTNQLVRTTPAAVAASIQGNATGTWSINVTGNAATITNQKNSATTDASTGINGNHIVQRDANGYIYASHINFNTGEAENPTINSFITGNGDGWSRKSSLAHVKNSIRGVADGTWSINVTGNAATSNGFPTNYIGGQQTNPQAYFNSTVGLRVAMTGTPVVWADTLWINGYAGGDVPNMCALHTSRQGTPRMWISSQSNLATSYGTAYEFPTLGYNSGNTAGLYSGVYYDSNDTGYYADPNGASSFNVTTSNEFYSNGWFRNNNSNTGVYNQATLQHWYSDSGSYWNMGGGNVNGQGIRFRDTHNGTVRGYVYYDQSNNVGFLNQDGNWRARVVGGDYFLADGSSARAQLFYDSNNTGYYLDPASGSRLGSINSDLLRTQTNVYIDQQYGSSLVGAYSSTRYQGVYAMGDAYKLAIDGTTAGNLYGIAWAHPNAGGVASNLNTHGALFLENGGFLAAISGSIRSRDDMRSPIFYDSNDTAWYVNPNSDSNLNTLRIRASGISLGSGNSRQLEINNAGSGACNISFHREGAYGAHFGLDTDNWFSTYGWSAGGGYTSMRVGSFYAYGSITATDNITAYSDARLKENIQTISGALSKVQQLKGVTYTRNDLEDTTRRYGGLIAQDVQKVLPEAVTDTGDKLAVDYNATIGLLVEAIKELQAKIETLEAKG